MWSDMVGRLLADQNFDVGTGPGWIASLPSMARLGAVALVALSVAESASAKPPRDIDDVVERETRKAVELGVCRGVIGYNMPKGDPDDYEEQLQRTIDLETKSASCAATNRAVKDATKEAVREAKRRRRGY